MKRMEPMVALVSLLTAAGAVLLLIYAPRVYGILALIAVTYLVYRLFRRES